jgi:cytochrome c553
MPDTEAFVYARTWWLVSLFAACGGRGGSGTLEEREDAWLARMTEIDSHAIAARDALAGGDLGKARTEGRALRESLPPDGVPARLTAALDQLDAARTPREGAVALAELSVGCLQCHAERHASLAMREPQPVRPATGTISAEMERHRVFVDGVWLGLIGGEPAKLHEAIAFLDQGSLVAGTPVRRDPGFTLTAAAAALDRRVHTLAHELEVAPADQRPPLFADLLGTCADCHALQRSKGGLTTTVAAPPNPAMNDHFVDLLTLELGVIGGDVPAARAAAARLAVAAIAAPPGAETHVRALAETAGKMQHMDSLAALADGTASLLVTCGQCHAATGKGPVAAVEPVPGPEASEMGRHLYASFWMGQSLLANDEVAWSRGTQVLRDAGLGPLGANAKYDELVHALGERATRATEPADRARVLGELLATCSPCHEQLPR